MTSSRKMIMYFETEDGENYKVPINNVKDDLTLSEVENVSADIISNNVFFTNGGDLKSLKYAQIITTTTEILK